MKLWQACIIALSLLILIAPSTIGLIASNQYFNRQMTDYGDDGERYVIGAGISIDADTSDISVETGEVPGDRRALLRLLDDFAFIDSTINNPTDDLQAVTSALTRLAQSAGWSARTVQNPQLDTLLSAHGEGAYVALLERPGAVIPYLILDADRIFVTAYEAHTGKVLYRRHAFTSAWTGVAMELSLGVSPQQ